MEVQKLPDHGLDAVNAGVAELHHFMAFGANNVVVLAVPVAFLVLGKVAAELVLANEALLDQKVQGVVDGGTAHLQPTLLHAGVKLFDIEVTGTSIYFFENGIPLAGFAQAFVFEMGGEELAHLVQLIGIEGGLRGGAGRMLGRITRFGRAASYLVYRSGGVGGWRPVRFRSCLRRIHFI